MKRILTFSTYLVRNGGKSLPLIGVIVLAVLLIVGIVALMNSIPYSIRTIYKHSKNYTGLVPRSNASVDHNIRKEIRDGSPVPIEPILVIRGSQAQVKSIVGGWPFVVLAMRQDDMRRYAKRLNITKIEGRYPKAGEAEALISEPVARNLKLKLGDPLLKPDNADAYSMFPVKIVGIAQTDYWTMMMPYEYHEKYHFPPYDSALVFAKNPADQDKLDRWIHEKYRGANLRVFAYFLLEEETNSMFRILYQILNVVIFTLVAVITLMMAMLINIYQSQRIQEFGLLQALGYTRRDLIRRVLGESIAVVLVGWILGVAAAQGMLQLVKARLMDPNAFALDVWDRSALLYTIPVPVMIFLAAVGAIWSRFRTFDPVSVVERRLA